MVGSATFAQAHCDPTIDHVVTGQSFYNNGNFDAALNSFNCAVTLKPDQTAAILNLRGNVHRQTGDLQQALADYSSSIEANSESAIVFNNRGWTYTLLDNFDAALEDFNRAIELSPELAYAYNNRGVVLMEKGRYEEAAADFIRAINLNHDPLDWPQTNLEQLLASVDIDVDSLDTVIETDKGGVPEPDSEQPLTDNDHYSDGLRAYGEERYEDAIESFTAVIEQFPDSPRLCCSYNYRARSYIAIGDYDSALADYNTLIERDPGKPSNYLKRGAGYAVMGEIQKAAEDFYLYLDLQITDLVDGESLEIGKSTTIDMEQGVIFYYSFELEAGETVSVRAKDIDPDHTVDPLLIITDDNDIALAGDDDGGGDLNAKVIFTAPESGTYRIVVGHAQGGSEGQILIQLCRSNNNA